MALACQAAPRWHQQRAAAAPPHRVQLPARPCRRGAGSCQASSLPAASCAGVAAGLLLLLPPAGCAAVEWQQPAAPPPLVLLDGNAAIVRQLQLRSKTQQRFGAEDPRSALSSHFQAAQQQLGRIELLATAGEWNNARLQLRDGAFKSLRMDLGYGQEMYRVIQPQLAREVLEGVERLDGQLKRREAGAVKPTLAGLDERLGQLAEVMAELAVQ